MSGEHPVPKRDGDGNGDGDGDERRHHRKDVRVVVPSGLQDGWLAFQNGDEKRRLTPIPDGWSVLTERELCALLREAKPHGRPRR
jgi:hypothetical protein